ncbi:hypothetical protein HYH03_005064 [Edaphochlamys debaryana]|uniref:Uncharacterized protein n=1 Tax=Edaphochlamys debaryana TaxID=47281 RepID=A0A836C2Q8_9CHLO|nr:hypothetical protein HYH03_005064 [Edaphochlamys debaryana]|eukprot:KAG2497067.1 hypothetical protein HYH03_005064 [Edaphochlamys debaryana]
MAASVLAPNSELWKPPTTTPQPTLPPDPTDADMSACMLAGQAVASHPLDPDPTKAWSSVAVIASDLSPSHECRSGTVISQLSAGKALEQGLQHLADTLDKMLQLPATAGPLSQAWPPATSWPDVPSSPSAYGDPCEEDPTGLAAPSPLLPQPHPSPQSSSTSGEGGLTGRWSLFSSSGGSGGGGGGGSAFSVDVDASRLAVEIPPAPAEAVSTPPLRTTPRRSPAFATLPRLDSGVEYIPGPEEALGPSPGLSPSRLGFRQFDERGSATQEVGGKAAGALECMPGGGRASVSGEDMVASRGPRGSPRLTFAVTVVFLTVMRPHG